MIAGRTPSYPLPPTTLRDISQRGVDCGVARGLIVESQAAQFETFCHTMKLGG